MTILIVDDSSTFRDSLVKLFHDDNGYDCKPAVDGKDALEKWQNDTSIKLILADHNMPNLTGIEMATEIRTIEKSRGIDPKERVCIIMLTAESSASLKAKAKELQVKAWIIKPVSDNALLSVAKKLLA